LRDMPRVHPGLRPGLQCDGAEGIGPDARDQAHLRPGPRGGHGLVRSLAAGAELEAFADQRLAHRGKAWRQERQIGGEDAEDDDRGRRAVDGLHLQASELSPLM